MKSFSLQKITFNKAMSAVKNSLSKDNYRPVLKRVKCEVDANKIVFTSCNGYAITTYEIKTQQETEPFSFVFDWFKIDEDKQGIAEILFTQNDTNEVFCKYEDNNSNEICKTIYNPNEEYIDCNNVIKDAKKDLKYEVILNLKLLQDALKSHKDSVKFSFSENPASPIIIKSINASDCKTLSLVLPLRDAQ